MNNLEIESNKILCNHLNYLNEKINNENELLYKKKFIHNSPNYNNSISQFPENINYLKSSYISKKDCIFTSTEIDLKEWEKNFYNINITPNFNISTKPKSNNFDFNYICP